MKNSYSIKQKSRLLDGTDSSTDYNRIIKYKLSFGGEIYDSNCPVWFCDCPNHRRYWAMKDYRMAKRYFKHERSWKKHRKTQYKNLEN
jgi:hypothetical protein